MIELYDSSEIRFVAPLTRQEEFLVPEATEEPAAESEGPLTEEEDGAEGTVRLYIPPATAARSQIQ